VSDVVPSDRHCACADHAEWQDRGPDGQDQRREMMLRAAVGKALVIFDAGLFGRAVGRQN
jgi:hypothetical protein